MKVTVDTITDEQIRELLAEAQRYDTGTISRRETMRMCTWALERGHVQRYAARARCAEIWNARHATETKR